jgi:hypothetical protein
MGRFGRVKSNGSNIIWSHLRGMNSLDEVDFAVSFQSQIPDINVSFLSQRPVHTPKLSNPSKKAKIKDQINCTKVDSYSDSEVPKALYPISFTRPSRYLDSIFIVSHNQLQIPHGTPSLPSISLCASALPLPAPPPLSPVALSWQPELARPPRGGMICSCCLMPV